MPRRLFYFLMFTFLALGCAINLPFNNDLSYQAAGEARALSNGKQEPIAIKWVPEDFPERVDVQGASGYVGGASNTRIPIGIGLASRIREALDAAIGVNDSSPRVLLITVINTKSKFEYSGNVFNMAPEIDSAKCTFEADFRIGEKEWHETFNSHEQGRALRATSQTGCLEKVWDDTALQVTRSVVQNL